MSTKVESDAAIAVAEMRWPATLDGAGIEKQERLLLDALEAATAGLVIDCAGVEIGNSDIINVLMRLRNRAKALNKEIVLCNSPESLHAVIQLCELQQILPEASSPIDARQMIEVRNSQRGLAANKTLVWMLAGGMIALAVAGYLMFR